MPTFEPVIGLEIHVQLLTDSKLFCGCRARFGGPPNTNVCPVCLGLPGALPVLNGRAVALAVTAAAALGCTIHPVSRFARKNYFYPDLPKGYQISQFDRPLATGGFLDYDADGGATRVGIVRLHLEEDAGKSLHDGLPDSNRATSLDFNRSGVPLIEIVTRPEIRSAAGAAAVFTRLRERLVAVGATDGNMEEGSLRCDANVSLRLTDADALGTKTEIKNVNSFRYVQRALEFEIARQSALMDTGGSVVHETRSWDARTGRTELMRSKEDSPDYRYFPEPDLPPLVLDPQWLERVVRHLPELPDARRRRFVTEYGLPEYDAGVLTQSPALADYFEATAAEVNAKAASNWIMGELLRKLKETATGVERSPMSPTALAGLIRLVESGSISGPVAKTVFEQMYDSGRDAAEIVASQGLARMDDEGVIAAIVREVLARHSKAIEQFRAGKSQTFGFLVGQVIKATQGRANPAVVNLLVRRALERDSEDHS